MNQDGASGKNAFPNHPIPKRAAKRPRVGVLPIPFVTLVPADGNVKFNVEDRRRVKRCGYKSLCQFCGQRLDVEICFIGGETATEQRLFRQAPFHKECARYAVATCPYLRNTFDPQFATFCKSFKMQLAEFPLTEPGQITVIEAFTAHRVVRVDPVGKWCGT